MPRDRRWGGRAPTEALHDDLAAALREIAQLRSELAELRQSAMLDHLTQLGNRRMLDQALPQEMREAAASGAPLCFALADIDEFKAFNDRHGHAAGDCALQIFARILKQTLKGQDAAIRFGGEEFALILPRTPIEAVASLLDRIRESFAQSGVPGLDAKEAAGPVTASFGVAQFDGVEDAASLIRRADAQLYCAKQAGRNQVRR